MEGEFSAFLSTLKRETMDKIAASGTRERQFVQNQTVRRRWKRGGRKTNTGNSQAHGGNAIFDAHRSDRHKLNIK